MLPLISSDVLLSWIYTHSEPKGVFLLPLCACSVTKLWLILCNPIGYSPPGSSANEVFQARYWSGLPFPPSGDLPDPGIKSPSSLVAPALHVDSLPLSHLGSPLCCLFCVINKCKFITWRNVLKWIKCHIAHSGLSSWYVSCVKSIAVMHAPYMVVFELYRRYQKLQKIMKPW